MKTDLCTIPIEDIFAPKDGCPICRMRDILEQRGCEYSTGAAVMEPDVRIRMNELGCCNRHYAQMLKGSHRLQVALGLSTRLDELDKTLFGGKFVKPSPQKRAYRCARVHDTCFVCEKVEDAMEHFFNTLFRLYANDREFAQSFREQSSLCIPHYGLLLTYGEKMLDKKTFAAFCADAEALTRKTLDALREDVTHFTKMYDYRNNTPDADWGNSKDSIERAVRFLTGFEKGEE